MADGLEETEKLFARANAAIAEATRLAEESYVRRKNLCEAIKLMISTKRSAWLVSCPSACSSRSRFT